MKILNSLNCVLKVHKLPKILRNLKTSQHFRWDLAYFSVRIPTLSFFICFQIQEGTYDCTMCEKKCKSKSGLTRHLHKKHDIEPPSSHRPNSSPPFSEEIIREKLLDCIEKMRQQDRLCQISFDSISSLTIVINKISRKTIETFYQDFYAKIVKIAENYIPDTNSNSANLVLSKLCTSLIGHHFRQKKELNVVSNARNISEREIAGLQYLGGYIRRHVYYAMKREWYITQNFEQILLLTEKNILFRGKKS